MSPTGPKVAPERAGLRTRSVSGVRPSMRLINIFFLLQFLYTTQSYSPERIDLDSGKSRQIGIKITKI